MKKYIGIALGLFLVCSPVYAETVQEQYVSLLRQVIVLLEQQVATLVAQLQQIKDNPDLTIATSTPNLSTPNFGSIIQLPPNPITMDNKIEELSCTLSVDKQTGSPSSYITVTWTSNADSAFINSDKVTHQRSQGRLNPLYGWDLVPASGGTISLPLSSEPGEINTFTAHFVRGIESKDCSVQVTTQ